jgi:hypothetical protein
VGGGGGESQAEIIISGANLKELDLKPAPVPFTHRESHMNSPGIETETEMISHRVTAQCEFLTIHYIGINKCGSNSPSDHMQIYYSL